jgi:hypothetical protein
MTETDDNYWRDVGPHLKAERKRRGQSRLGRANDDFPAARDLAVSRGWKLRRCSETQYNLVGPNGELYQLYPSKCRVYTPPSKKYLGRFLDLPPNWTLTQAVEAATAVERDQ